MLKKYRNKNDIMVSIIQFIKFSIVGFSNTVISYLIYVIALKLLETNHLYPKIDYLIAQVAGFILSVMWSFYWNNKYVFQREDKLLKALMKTYISYAFTGLFLNTLLSALWVEVFSISKMITPIINLCISVPLNFILNKFWAFRKAKDKK